ncbi:hypothetical protein D187_006910 [Cystobacter fuscus DSM 2262]|uniref:Uncharacterized protein n=1 Tax=Cystobacter fuscus (strain ATCC 25194 / DSM 2262 / NBRC 100088 / M29) TaxID=1242864 RepID=S9P221_CYSF2|nr:hypothetical protein [Cystobacter fuscus]EPX57156.1 hypothetical protein D187_006910 [Cystobacter fuscus DSM 2262]
MASADTLDILGPSAAVAPEGFSIALVRRDASGSLVSAEDAAVSASGARLLPGTGQPPLRTFLVVPEPGVRRVRVSAQAGEARSEADFSLGPPATHVSLSLEPSAPVKGRDKEARLTVRILQPDGTPEDSGAPPVLRANVGRVEELVRAGPGTWTARYVLPDTRFPEVAVLVALSAWPHPQSIHGAYGRVLVPLAAAVELPGRTEPNAQLSVSIAGVDFGPVKAAADGRFRLPVIVPPGHDTAQASAVDKAGNVRRTKMNLGLPPTDGLACVLHPQRLPPDGVSQARLLCATSDSLGQPVHQARVEVSARHGTLRGPTHAPGGLLEWRYTAPASPPRTPERLLATWPERGAGSREELPLQLEQGPVARVALELAEPLVHLGSTVRVTTRAWDAAGQRRPGAVVVPRSPLGTFSAPREQTPGVVEHSWSLPPLAREHETTLEVLAYGPVGTEPARLSVWVDEGVLYAGVTDSCGLPVPEQPLRVGDARLVTGADGTGVLGPARPGRLEVFHERWPGLRRTLDVLAEGGPVFPVDPSPRAPRETRRVRLAPEAPVNVRLKVDGARVTYWMEDATGRVLEGREAHVWLSAGEKSAVEVEGGRGSFVVKNPGPLSVSVADVATGVTAMAEVRP